MGECCYVCGHFWAADDPFLAAFSAQGVAEDFPQGVFLQRQGNCPSRVFLLLEGCVETCVLLEDGRRRAYLLHAGRVALGLAGLDKNNTSSGVSIRCLTPVRALWADSRQVLGWPPELLLPLAMCQTQKMQIVYRQLRERSFLSAEEQLLRILEEIASSGMLEQCRNVRLPSAFLAELLGLSRPHLGTVLARVSSGRLSEGQRAALAMVGEAARNG